MPYPKNIDEFNQISEIGKKLRELHTMVNSSTWIVEIGYPIVGSNLVEKVEFKDLRVYINETQYFDNIQESMFNYYIGGYQPAQSGSKTEKAENYHLRIFAITKKSYILSRKPVKSFPSFMRNKSLYIECNIASTNKFNLKNRMQDKFVAL